MKQKTSRLRPNYKHLCEENRFGLAEADLLGLSLLASLFCPFSQINWTGPGGAGKRSGMGTMSAQLPAVTAKMKRDYLYMGL